MIFVAIYWTLSSMSLSLFPRSAELDTVPHVWPQQCSGESKDHLLQPAGSAPPNAAQDVFFASWAQFLALFQVGVSNSASLFCANLKRALSSKM